MQIAQSFPVSDTETAHTHRHICKLYFNMENTIFLLFIIYPSNHNKTQGIKSEYNGLLPD